MKTARVACAVTGCLAVLVSGAWPRCAAATQFVYVEIFCNNYPEFDSDGTLLNAGPDGKAPRNCHYFSNPVVAHYYPSPGDPGFGTVRQEQRDEEARIKQRAKETFEIMRQPCQSMTVNARAGYDSMEKAEDMSAKFMENYQRRGECAKSFDLRY